MYVNNAVLDPLFITLSPFGACLPLPPALLCATCLFRRLLGKAMMMGKPFLVGN